VRGSVPKKAGVTAPRDTTSPSTLSSI
jgi:hypothetical protein